MEKPNSEVITVRQLLRSDETKFVYIDNDDTVEKKMPEGREYIIPGYQRSISWNPYNMQILLRDVFVNGPKFLGIVLLSTSDYQTFEIIDGQQRITSILMILECLKQKSVETEITPCGFINNTFTEYNNVLSWNFEIPEEKKDTIEENDYLGQINKYKNLWICANEYIDNLSIDERLSLEEKLLDSYICVLITKVDRNSNESYRLCVDYFIDINNKSEQLSPIEIFKAYAFRENYKFSAEKWEIIQRNENKLKKIYYPKELMFLHYFFCGINDYAENKVKGITEDYKIKNTVSINDNEYLEGTDVEALVISKKSFYNNLLKNIEAFQNFMIIVERDKTSPSDDFAKYFVSGTDFDTIVNSFTVISGILHNSDVIPKMLLLKYFIDVLNDKTKSDNKSDILFNINVLAVSFSASKSSTKSSTKFGSIVLSDKWEDKIEKEAQKILNSFIDGIGFEKEMTHNKQVTSTSGEYMARRVIGLLHAYTKGSSEWVFNQNEYKIIMDTQSVINCEHFLFDENQTYSFMYKGKRIEKGFPTKMKNRYISYISNFMLINKNINTEMGNSLISEKISIIRKHINNSETDIFFDEYSRRYFELAEQSFSETECPTADVIDSAQTEEEACVMVETYISENYLDEVRRFIELLTEKMQVWHTLKTKIDFCVQKTDSIDGEFRIECISSKGVCFASEKYLSWPLYMLDSSKPKDWQELIEAINEDRISNEVIEKTEIKKLYELRNEYVEQAEMKDILNELTNINGSVGKCIYCIWDIKSPDSVPIFFSKKDDMLNVMEKSLEDELRKWDEMSLKEFKECMKKKDSHFKKTMVLDFKST